MSDDHRSGAGVERVTTVVVGAGHAGLSASHFLTERSIDHVVLERGEVANSWRHERWDSLRLLTPNWQTHLPGQPYDGPDPDGYMTMGVSIRSESQRSCRQEFATSPRSRTRWSIDRAPRKWLAASPD